MEHIEMGNFLTELPFPACARATGNGGFRTLKLSFSMKWGIGRLSAPTASQLQSLAIFWIASEIARNFRSEKQIWSSQNASQPPPYRYHREIATVSLPQRNCDLFPGKNRCVQFDIVNKSQTLTANHLREMVHLVGRLSGVGGIPIFGPLVILWGGRKIGLENLLLLAAGTHALLASACYIQTLVWEEKANQGFPNTNMGEDYYQTYARSRVEPVLFCPKYTGISRKWLEMALYSLRESQVSRNSGAIPVWEQDSRVTLIGPIATITLSLSVATPAEPRGEKLLFLVQILGGDKLLKFVEKCRWNIFKRPERG